MRRPSILARFARLLLARTRRRLRRSDGYAAILVCLTVPVLLALIGLGVDFGTLAYHKAKVQQAADSAAIAAVKNQSVWHVPVPTKFFGPIPIDGVVIHAMHLNNLGWAGEPLDAVQGIARVNQDAKAPISLSQNRYVPGWNVLAPFHYIEMTATSEVPLHFGKLWGSDRSKVEAKGCAIAWIRPDFWGHGWWTNKTAEAVMGKELNFYRAVPCVDDEGDFWDMANVLMPAMLQLAEGRADGVEPGLADNDGWKEFAGKWTPEGAMEYAQDQMTWENAAQAGSAAAGQMQEQFRQNQEACKKEIARIAQEQTKQYEEAHEHWSKVLIPQWEKENKDRKPEEKSPPPPEPQKPVPPLESNCAP